MASKNAGIDPGAAPGVTGGELGSKVAVMILPASQQLFWYFSYPTPLALVGDRLA
jgi:hypothetical protein